MNKSKLESKIFDFAVENTKNPFPSSLSNGTGDVFLGMDMFDVLNKGLVKNAVYDIKEGGSVDVVNASRASSFAASAICQLYIAEKVRNNIDLFADDPKNQKYFEDFLPGEKEVYISELKNKATGRLEVNAKTIYGKDFVQNLSDKFNEYVKKDKSYAKRLLGDGLGVVIELNDKLADTKGIERDILEVREKYEVSDKPISFNKQFVDLILNGISENAAHLAEKKGGMFADIDVRLNYDTKANSDAFLKRYKSNSLTDEDKEWAKDFFVFRDIDEVKIDGNTVYTREQIERKGEKETAAELLGAVLSGKNVSYKDYEYGAEYIVDYEYDNFDKFEKSLWDKIVDFVRQALGLDRHYNIVKSIQSDNEKIREKMSFEEISGIKNIKNVKSPSAEQKEPIIERNEPTR